MNSLILRTTSRTVLVAAFAFSLYVYWRGHNEPGGGFVGGLVAAAGLIVYGFPRGVDPVRSLLRVSPFSLLGVGLLFALLSGTPALIEGKPFLTHAWTHVLGLHLGTPMLFDLGVYCVVVGAVTGLFSLFLEQ